MRPLFNDIAVERFEEDWLSRGDSSSHSYFLPSVSPRATCLTRLLFFLF